MSDKSCFTIHFDSLASSGLTSSRNFPDPSFFNIADRFFELSTRYGFKYTISIIGRDLENSETARRVKAWSDAGHEIANHSYNHRENLGCLDYNELEMEVMKSHEIIAKVCGKEPKGFVAPAWATSLNLLNILLKNGYSYDTSVFPSYFIWVLLAKVYWSRKTHAEKTALLPRLDWTANLFASRKPYFSNGKSLIKKSPDGLLIIPLPATPILRIPCWHTMSFLLPESLFNSVLNSCLTHKYFYYVLHPADLLDKDDISIKHGHTEYIYRSEITITEKTQKLDASIKKIIDHSSSISTLAQIAEDILSENRNEKNGK